MLSCGKAVTLEPSACWPFDDPPNVAVFTSRHIVQDGKPVLLVSHDNEDGAWQFHYGGAVANKDTMIVALAEVLKLHPDIAELSDLPCGWRARREAPGKPWIREREVEDD
jgi:hypothetical protein